MVKIVVSPEQARQLKETLEAIEIVDDLGNCIGVYTQPFSRDEIEEAKRRAASERGGRTTAEVLDRLSQLELE